jgi:hypothetical protein
MENIERVFRSLGAVQLPYFTIFKPQQHVTLRQIAGLGKRFVRQRLLPIATLFFWRCSAEFWSNAVGQFS